MGNSIWRKKAVSSSENPKVDLVSSLFETVKLSVSISPSNLCFTEKHKKCLVCFWLELRCVPMKKISDVFADALWTGLFWWTGKTQIRLCGCACWSEFPLSKHIRGYVFSPSAQIYSTLQKRNINAKFQTIFVVCSVLRMKLLKVKLNVKQRKSMLFTKAYYYRLRQWNWKLKGLSQLRRVHFYFLRENKPWHFELTSRKHAYTIFTPLILTFI